MSGEDYEVKAEQADADEGAARDTVTDGNEAVVLALLALAGRVDLLVTVWTSVASDISAMRQSLQALQAQAPAAEPDTRRGGW